MLGKIKRLGMEEVVEGKMKMGEDFEKDGKKVKIGWEKW